MERYELVVHFNDDTSIDMTVSERSVALAIIAAMKAPEVWKLASAITRVEVA